MATRALPVDTLTPAERATWENPIHAQSPTANLPAIPEYDDEEETDADRVSSMLGEITDERAFVKVQRVIGPNKYSHCDEYSVAEYLEGGVSMIREQWGPGEYDVRLYGPKPETGKFGVVRKGRIVIEKRRGEESAPRQNSELSQVLQTIAQGQQQMLAALTERPPAPDAQQQLMTLLSMMGAMREAMGANSPQKNQLSDIVSAMREMREVSAEFAPKEAPDTDNPMAMLPSILELVKTGMQQRPAAPVQQAMPAVGYHVPGVIETPIPQPLPQPDPQPTGESEMDLAGIALMGHMNRMMILAKSGADPAQGATIIYEKLPDEMIDLLETPEWFAMLEQVFPAAAPYKEWLTKARDLALAQFEADAAGDPPELPAP
jgi:hypothetical protein